jgi:hypothetical protein
MVEQITRTIATADGTKIESDPPRYRGLALAALKPLTRPTEAMGDAAHQAVWSDAFWAINNRADFKKAVRAMIRAAMAVNERYEGDQSTLPLEGDYASIPHDQLTISAWEYPFAGMIVVGTSDPPRVCMKTNAPPLTDKLSASIYHGLLAGLLGE